MHITIIYSSGGGNTKLVIDRISDILTQHGHTTTSINAFVAQPTDLVRTSVTILAAPTYDHGVLHQPFEHLLDQAGQIDLTGYQYAIVGLGDDKYDAQYNITSAKILMEFVVQHQGNIHGSGLLINKSPVDQLDGLVTDRTQDLLTNLDA